MVVATSSHPWVVADELMQPNRLEQVVHLPLPDSAARLHHLMWLAERQSCSPEVDLALLAEQTAGIKRLRGLCTNSLSLLFSGWAKRESEEKD